MDKREQHLLEQGALRKRRVRCRGSRPPGTAKTDVLGAAATQANRRPAHAARASGRAGIFHGGHERRLAPPAHPQAGGVRELLRRPGNAKPADLSVLSDGEHPARRADRHRGHRSHCRKQVRARGRRERAAVLRRRHCAVRPLARASGLSACVNSPASNPLDKAPRRQSIHFMNPLTHARAMAAYNRWMNERIYECCARLSDEERKRDAGAFFKSIHGTLNHLLLGDRIWLGRFMGTPFVVKSLGEELYSDFPQLRSERRATDVEISNWISSLSEDDLADELSYMSV